MIVYRLAHPELLHWLWLIPIVVLVAKGLEKKRRKLLARQFGEKLLPFLTSSLSTSRRRWKLILDVLVVTGFLIAWARPQAGQSVQKVKSEGIEMVILFDVSNSMLAEDARPSRLSLAKAEINRLLQMSVADRVGLVAFAGSAVVLSPLTTDIASLKMFIDSLVPDSVSTQGTYFEVALREAKEAFRRGGSEGDDQSAVTRVVVVVSDGEDQEEGAIKAAEELKKHGIRVFALGFGTEKGGAIPIRDEWGNLRGYKKDKAGQVVLSQTKGTVLRDLAQSGGGSFHHVTFGGSAIRDLRGELEKLEKSEFESAEVTNFDEKFQLFLICALLIALIEIMLSERAPRGRIWRGRFEVEPQ